MQPPPLDALVLHASDVDGIIGEIATFVFKKSNEAFAMSNETEDHRKSSDYRKLGHALKHIGWSIDAAEWPNTTKSAE